MRLVDEAGEQKGIVPLAEALKALALTVSFFVNSPLPRILTPSLGFLTIPVSINVATETSAPSSNLSNTLMLIPTIAVIKIICRFSLL